LKGPTDSRRKKLRVSDSNWPPRIGHCLCLRVGGKQGRMELSHRRNQKKVKGVVQEINA
jgi:hypothetical protein